MQELGDGDPRQIGGYRLLGRLGSGGMGHVHLARSDRGRTVAVKLVREELAAREEFRARFRYEVEAARRVGGHWTAPVLDADTEAAVPWVATGYVAGPSLQQVVGHDHGPLPERSLRTLAAGLAHALQDIHTAGLVHRDLKPSNVLLTIDGPRVIDFGIARALETVSDGGVTRAGALVGSPGFMAPEQVRGGGITPACDIFCLGSVLVYAATGRMPFGTAQTGSHVLMYRIAHEEPDLKGVPESLVGLVLACLEKNPAARPGLAEVLRRTGARDTVSDGVSHDPWLPGSLVAQLGRHAVSLLDTEDPEPPASSPRHDPRPAPATAPGPAAASFAGAAPPHQPTGLVTGRSPLPPQPSPSPQRPPSRRRRRGRIALLIVALVATLSAGSVLYILMRGDGDHRAGSVPTGFLGTWTAIDNDSGTGTLSLTIKQGDVGDTVLSLVADGPKKNGNGTYHCVFKGDLTNASGSDDPVHIDSTAPVVAEPRSSCDPGKPTTLTLLPNDTLRRAVDHTGKSLTYTRK
ncbi:serine/threonine-protein kinase [Streptomyces sp. NPDC002746]